MTHTPAERRGSLTGRDLVAVPVLDAVPVSLVLAWPERSRSVALAAFVRIAAEVAARNSTSPPGPVP